MIGAHFPWLDLVVAQRVQILSKYAYSGPVRNANVYPDDVSRICIDTCIYFNSDLFQFAVAIDRPKKIRSGNGICSTASLEIFPSSINALWI
jgi:hypothetical protein